MGALWAAGRGEGWSRIDIKREKDRKTAIFEEESEKIASFPLFLLFVSPGHWFRWMPMKDFVHPPLRDLE